MRRVNHRVNIPQPRGNEFWIFCRFDLPTPLLPSSPGSWRGPRAPLAPLRVGTREGPGCSVPGAVWFRAGEGESAKVAKTGSLAVNLLGKTLGEAERTRKAESTADASLCIHTLRIPPLR